MSILVGDTFVRVDSASLGSDWAVDETNGGIWSIEKNSCKVYSPVSVADGTVARSTEDDYPTYYTAYATVGSALPADGLIGIVIRSAFSSGEMTQGYAMLVQATDKYAELIAFDTWPTKRILSQVTGAYTIDISAGDVLSMTIEPNSNGNPLITGYLNGGRILQSEETGTEITGGKAGLIYFGNASEGSMLFNGFQTQTLGTSRPKQPRITHISDLTATRFQIVLLASQFIVSDNPDDTLHKQSRWQLGNNSAWSYATNVKYDSGWVDDMLTTAYIDDINPDDYGVFDTGPVTVYARVKYRDEYGNETDWSSSSYTFTMGNTADDVVQRPKSTVAPFPHKPGSSYDFKESAVNITVVQRAEDGSELRLPKREQVLRRFELSFRNMALHEMEIYWDHFTRAKGKHGVFVFKHPITDALYTVRYEEDSFDRQEFEANIFQSQGISLVEVI